MSKANIVTLDIETAPMQSYHWGLWKENIGLEQIGLDWSILSYSYKWLGDSKVHFRSTGGRGTDKVRDDAEILKELWEVLDKADIVITQNGKAFDIPKINTRMIIQGLLPYSPIKIIDTKLAATKHFAFSSNRLAWLSKLLSSQPKSEHKKFPGFELWAECLKDNPAAWKEMEKYNKIDVLATEEVYLKMRPWIEGHPNVPLIEGTIEIACPRCGSTHVQRRGYKHTQVGTYIQIFCQTCGGWARMRQTVNREQGKNLLVT